MLIKNFKKTYVTIKDETIPIIKEIENPLIGPKPKAKRKIAANKVVKLESRIVTKAELKPSFFGLSVLCLKFSLILSKIKTLASTHIPIVKTTPIMPGKVKVAFNIDISANNKTKQRIIVKEV
tara:strand:- start:79 stop:447 length:369 start_codon:yes stop_codon:yes gene_type:complete